KNIQEEVIKELHKLKIMHIVEHSKNELADIGKPMENANRLSETIVRVRYLITTLKINEEKSRFKLKRGLQEVYQTTKKLNDELNKRLEELKNLEGRILKNRPAIEELKILEKINLPLEVFAPYSSLSRFTGYIKDKSKVPALREELSKITEKFILLEDTSKKPAFAVLFIDRKSSEAASNLLQKNAFCPVNFTIINQLRGTASSNLIRIKKENERLEKRINTVQREIEQLRKEYKGFLIKSDEFLSQNLEKAEAPLKFAVTNDAFLIKGWIPTEELGKSLERLRQTSKNKLFIDFEDAKKEDKVPIKLKNPKHARAFEMFMNLYTLPTYGEIDPTFFIFLTFPLLFGFMLGDFGYGIVTLILFLVLKRYMPQAKNFFNILVFASLATIFFGLLFGEFFGYEEIAGMHFPHILSRSHQINELLYLAVGVGIMHINLGLIIGFANELKSHGFMKALYAKGGWLVLEAGVALAALSYLKIIVLPLYAGIIFFVLSLFMLFKGEGIKGLIEVPSIFSNTLSYARLMAIGLSSVKLAEVVNHLAGSMFNKGGFFILSGIILLTVGHVINIGIGMLGSFLHSLRLHYVEFFTKFFRGGAEKYKPFGIKP
ncbi:V-type ATP synthase subunit I, partial [Candidatus Woesearchaeota archaeon]|nr:V-type ATP synthase subunit I [Candidatus Woesearchaeota archaeon]